MEAELVNDKFDGDGDEKFHCLVQASLDANEPKVEILVRVTILATNENLAEINLTGVATNPITFTGIIVTAATYYGLCVSFSIGGAAAKIVDVGYRKAKIDRPDERTRDHLLSGFRSLLEKKGDLAAETTKALVTCVQKLIPS